MFILFQNIDLELVFPFFVIVQKKIQWCEKRYLICISKSNGPAVSMLSEANVKEKLNGKTALALLNERSSPTYNETNYGNQFTCFIKLLNYENQISEFTGNGLVGFVDTIFLSNSKF